MGNKERNLPFDGEEVDAVEKPICGIVGARLS
jgi:hypothetical protein